MDEAERIEQFRKMAQANPEDDLAHYALGQALIDAERFAEAVNVLRHVLKINNGYSRAYLLLGISQERVEDSAGAIDTYQKGYAAAMNRGDLMPATEMKSRLGDLGGSVDADAVLAFAQANTQEDDGREPEAGEVRCLRNRRIGSRLDAPPFQDATGEFIAENICAESWDEWIEMSIKVINELRLDLGEPLGQKVYDEHMRDFLNLPDHLFPSLTED
jgi:Fe-S cluster biosynthesis and repair protein YggX